MGGQRLKIVALAALLPFAAMAEERGGSGACRADVQTYCASAGNKKECMLDHQNDVSDACYSFMKAQILRERRNDAAPQEPVAGTPAAPIYKYRDASGHLVYTNAAVPNASEVKDRTNIALPIR